MDDLPGTAAHCEGHCAQCAESFVLTKAHVLFCYIWPTTYILRAVLMTLFNDTKCLYLVIIFLLSSFRGKLYSVKIAIFLDSELPCVIGFVN